MGSKKVSQEEFINRAKSVHDGKYSYEKVIYIKATLKIVITCPEHGDFEQNPYDHINGKGCRKCWRDRIGRKQLQVCKDNFVSKANDIHNNKFTYDMSTYVNSRVKMRISCPSHGIFSQTPSNHLRGNSCPSCAAALNGAIKSAAARSVFVIKASEIHSSKYDYSAAEYINSNIKVKIYCKDHGAFWQAPYNHLSGKGCPSCSNGGFKPNEPAFLYVLITDGGFIGFGISGKLKKRLQTHKRNLSANNIEILSTFIFSGQGEHVLEAEKHIKSTFANSNVFIEGFKTEAFTNDKLTAVLDYLRKNSLLQ